MSETQRKRNAKTFMDWVLTHVLADHPKFPAIGAGVVVKGELVYQGVLGFRRKGSSPAVTLDDRFHMGSISKPLTGYLIAVLCKQGKLDWQGRREALSRMCACAVVTAAMTSWSPSAANAAALAPRAAHGAAGGAPVHDAIPHVPVRQRLSAVVVRTLPSHRKPPFNTAFTESRLPYTIREHDHES